MTRSSKYGSAAFRLDIHPETDMGEPGYRWTFEDDFTKLTGRSATFRKAQRDSVRALRRDRRTRRRLLRKVQVSPPGA